MAEYKDTLNLPFTDFPMKANLANREPQILEAWQAEDIYQKIRKTRKGAKLFILHDGPPYANGHLHCGHALNKILKDLVIKSKTLSGYDAPFVPGWDCHGLPVELNVEKKVGKVGVKIAPAAFRIQCREYAASQIDIQREEFRRLGVFGDWYNPYVTMDYAYEANIIRSLGLMIKNNHLQQGFKPVNWCIDCASALAEAEVEYEDKSSPSVDVAFIATNPEDFIKIIDSKLTVKTTIVPIWTTTPWTLPANEAVCLHKELLYTLVDVGHAYLLIATDLVETVVARLAIKDYKLCGQAAGASFEKLMLRHPFQDRLVPIVLGSHVTTESGTGAVHTAPAHGPDDYQVGLAYKLPLINPVLPNGCYAPDVPDFAGLSVMKANEPIIAALEKNKTLLHKTTISHSYPHCWRHKSPTIFLATPQWFIAMDKNGLRQAMLEQIETVTWVPEWNKPRIRGMIDKRPDWCISRQRAWNSPLPLFIHKTSRTLHPDTLILIEKVAKKIEVAGIEAWFSLDIAEFLGKDADFYEKCTDTLDVWLDSGVSHMAVLGHHPDLARPADLYFEGSDQHRGWFNSSLTTSVAMYGSPPYKTVLTHGFTVDGEGRKLSKSLGNFVALDKLINQHGADILRLWVASTDYRNEVSISDEIMKRCADAYRRIRNTARFLLANLFDFNPETDAVADKEMVELDKWALGRAGMLQEEIISAYEAFHFHEIFQKIQNFCVMDMGSFYLDIIKDRQYTTQANSSARRSCQTAMYHILHALTRWLAPILSFTAEEIWQAIPGKKGESVFLEYWYDAWPRISAVDEQDWAVLKAIRTEVNKALETARQEGLIGSALEAEISLYAPEDILPKLARLGDELRFLLISSEARALPLSESPNDAIVTDLGVRIVIKASSYEKCMRCWHRCADYGQDSQYPDLCLRCVGNITDNPEIRYFA